MDEEQETQQTQQTQHNIEEPLQEPRPQQQIEQGETQKPPQTQKPGQQPVDNRQETGTESYPESENPHRKTEQTQGIDTNFDAEQLKRKVGE